MGTHGDRADSSLWLQQEGSVVDGAPERQCWAWGGQVAVPSCQPPMAPPMELEGQSKRARPASCAWASPSRTHHS